MKRATIMKIMTITMDIAIATISPTSGFLLFFFPEEVAFSGTCVSVEVSNIADEFIVVVGMVLS